MLAAGFYLGAVLVGGGLVGLWARWSLGGRDPWVWAVLWLLEGRRRWSRPALLAYWAALGIISVAGWTRQLARSRRYRPRNQGGGANVDSSGQGQGSAYDEAGAPPSTDASGQTSPVAGVSGSQTLGLAFSGLPNLPNGAGMSQAATELFDAADKRVPLLSLNARRKYFHGLAVAMFLPGIAFDVSSLDCRDILVLTSRISLVSPHSHTCRSAQRLRSSRLPNTSATLLCIRSARQCTSS